MTFTLLKWQDGEKHFDASGCLPAAHIVAGEGGGGGGGRRSGFVAHLKESLCVSKQTRCALEVPRFPYPFHFRDH